MLQPCDDIARLGLHAGQIPIRRIHASECGQFSIFQKLKASMARTKTANAGPLLRSYYFLTLGLLSEIAKSNADQSVSSGRDTRYIVALNISTNPVSLWLIYDYTHRDYDFVGCVPNLEAALTGWRLYRDPLSSKDNVSVNPSQFFPLG